MTTTANRTSLPVLIAAWAAPILVLGGFALLAGIPIAIVLIGTLRDRRLHRLRWWTAALTTAYTVPLAFWLLGPSEEPSLSKYLNPSLTALLVATATATATAHHITRRSSGGSVREQAI